MCIRRRRVVTVKVGIQDRKVDLLASGDVAQCLQGRRLDNACALVLHGGAHECPEVPFTGNDGDCLVPSFCLSGNVGLWY